MANHPVQAHPLGQSAGKRIGRLLYFNETQEIAMIDSAVSPDFFSKMSQLIPATQYPVGVIPIPEKRIAGTAFFPGGSGLYLEDRNPSSLAFPFGGAMILGHNFDSELSFETSLKQGKEALKTGTWGPLIKLLHDAELPLEKCFFTNAYMGLCQGANSLKYRGRSDGPFSQACSQFLATQIATQRPRLIVTLGLYVPPFLARLSANLAPWSRRQLHLKDIDNAPIVFEAAFEGNYAVPHHANVVAIAHPSFPNNRKRQPHGFSSGREGEVELIRIGWSNTPKEAAFKSQGSENANTPEPAGITTICLPFTL